MNVTSDALLRPPSQRNLYIMNKTTSPSSRKTAWAPKYPLQQRDSRWRYLLYFVNRLDALYLRVAAARGQT